MSEPSSMSEPELRELAVKRLKARRDLRAHVLAYVTVNLFLVAIWWATPGVEFFWPVFPIMGWGIGLAFNIWDVYSPEAGPTQVAAEMNRLRDRVG